MAYDKVVDSSVLDAGLTQIADAIREKGGTSDSLAFPTDMAEAIAAIQTGGNEVTFNGKPVLGGTFVLTTDATSQKTLYESKGMFEANKAYTVFMFAVGVHSSLYNSVGKKGIYGSVSKRMITSNHNDVSAAGVFDNYGSGSAQNGYGLAKPYNDDLLSLRASSNAIGKAGVEYGWIAVEDGV